ncbi:MAG: RDD family protein [Clostridia bacterium]|nr:RDD family protein [Clostridia bacterium]
MTDLQKASISKRISAFLFDIIMVATVAVAIALLLSWATGYNGYMDTWNQKIEYYETECGVSFNITEEEYNKLTDEEKESREKAIEALGSDEEAVKAYMMMFSLSLVIVTFALLLAILIWDFIIPLKLKEGRTLGKKIFGLALMRTDGVRVTTFSLFVRAILGKFTVETMIPVLIILMIFFEQIGIVGLIVLLGMAILQVALFFSTYTKSAIHDVFAVTVVVDYHSQMIFDSTEELLAYKKRIHAEQAAKKDY